MFFAHLAIVPLYSAFFFLCPGSVVITTYSAVRIEHEDLVGLDWYYVVLDEGHLIKNPDHTIA